MAHGRCGEHPCPSQPAPCLCLASFPSGCCRLARNPWLPQCSAAHGRPAQEPCWRVWNRSRRGQLSEVGQGGRLTGVSQTGETESWEKKVSPRAALIWCDTTKLVARLGLIWSFNSKLKPPQKQSFNLEKGNRSSVDVCHHLICNLYPYSWPMTGSCTLWYYKCWHPSDARKIQGQHCRQQYWYW